MGIRIQERREEYTGQINARRFIHHGRWYHRPEWALTKHVTFNKAYNRQCGPAFVQTET